MEDKKKITFSLKEVIIVFIVFVIIVVIALDKTADNYYLKGAKDVEKYMMEFNEKAEEQLTEDFVNSLGEEAEYMMILSARVALFKSESGDYYNVYFDITGKDNRKYVTHTKLETD